MNIYLKETKYEFLKMLRTPRFALMTLSMPLLFYILYAVVIYKSHRLGGTGLPSYMLATFGSFGVLGVCLFGVGINLANERGLGWLEVKRASPPSAPDVLPGEADYWLVVLRGRSGCAVRARFCIGGRAARSFGCTAHARDTGRRLDSVRSARPGARIFREAGFGPGFRESDLSADGLFLGTLDAGRVSSESASARGNLFPGLPLESACLGRVGGGSRPRLLGPLAGAGMLHRDLSGIGDVWLPARQRT